MTPIQAQLAWEEQMVQHGVERYRAQQDNAVAGGRTHETTAGARLLRTYVIQVSDHMQAFLAGKHPAGRRRGPHAKLIDGLNTDKAALIAMKAVISTLFHPQTLQTLCISIGKVIEDELRFMRFHTDHKEYYEEIVRTFEANKTIDYRHKKRVLVHSSNSKGDTWHDWSKADLLAVGAMLLSLVMEASDLIERVEQKQARGRKEVLIVPTQECIDWVMQHNDVMEAAHPDRMPCLIPPEDWSTPTDGGYYSPHLRGRTPLVKHQDRGTAKAQLQRLRDADMPGVYSAVNAMQRTGWRVNQRVFDVMREVWHQNLGVGMPPSEPYVVPPGPLGVGVDARTLTDGSEELLAFQEWKAEARELYSLEKERVSKNLALIRTIRIATKMQDAPEFYYVYQCDFRGRMYSATTGLSPQGTDHGKALLQFADAQPLGERGLYWLKVHGANKYGEDKSSYAERVAWIEHRHQCWMDVAADPLGNTAHWQDADKPYQFLAFCFEYAAAATLGASFRSRLPVALDGSCNGLQHFSAMLRDEVGGSAVNLVPAAKPSDIYAEVAGVCTRKLSGLRSLNTERSIGAANWLALFEKHGTGAMPRDLSKKPVMTLPYGSTRQACTETIFRWAYDKDSKFFDQGTSFRHALYLSPLLWESIGEVVIAARAAMDWIQVSAGRIAKAGFPLEYTSPLGFPVYQIAYEYETRCIETQIGGRLRVRMAEDTDKISARIQRQGSSPNLIHHVDATHMMMCINAGAALGISAFAMIHDDFGVHACHVDKWHTVIRGEFIRLHTEHDILNDFKKVHEERHGIDLPPLPPRGTLNISQVAQSDYFFG